MKNKRKKGKNRINLGRSYYVMIIISLILIIFSFFILIPKKTLKTEIIDVEFIVGENMGLDLNTSKLTFGRLIKDSSIERFAVIENDYEYPIKLKIYVSEDISDFLYSNDYEYIINSKESKQISFILRVPENAESGNYSGKIRLEFRKLWDNK